MFHTYILAQSGATVDFDRASYLMDRDLLTGSVSEMQSERDNRPRADATYDAQWVWEAYCDKHFERHGVAFRPDVDPTWDQSDGAGTPAKPAPAMPAPASP